MEIDINIESLGCVAVWLQSIYSYQEPKHFTENA